MMSARLTAAMLILSAWFFAQAAWADCAVTGATPQGGEVVTCTGSDTDGYDGTGNRDTLTVAVGANVDRLAGGDTVNMNGGNDEVTVNGGSVNSDTDCFEGNDGADQLIMNSGTLTCDSDGIKGVGGADRIEFHGGSITVGADGLEGDAGDDVIIMTGGTITLQTGADSAIEADEDNDTVTLSGGTIDATNGANAVDAGSGNDVVEFSGDVTVVGVIDGDADTDTLRFSMQITQGDAVVINQQLAAANPASDSIMINGNTYTWINFESIDAAVGAPTRGPAIPVPVDGRWALLALLALLALVAARRLTA